MLDSGDKISGDLHYAPGIPISLDLVGVSDDLSRQIARTLRPEPGPINIQGYSTTGEPVALLNCYRGKQTTHAAGRHEVTFHPQFAIFGGSTLDIPDYARYEIVFSGLYYWAHLNDPQFDKSTEPSSATTRVSHKSDLDWNGHLESGLNIKIRHETGRSLQTTDYGYSSSLFAYPIIEISHDRGYISLTEIFSIISSLQALLTLFVGHQVGIRRILGFDVSEGGYGNNIYCPLPYHGNPPSGQVSAYRFNEIAPHLTQILNNWMELESENPVTSRLYLSTIYQGQFSHVAFLSQMQAIESWLRTTQDGKYLDEDVFRDKLVEIQHAIREIFSGDIRRALTHRAKFFNEYSLNKRILSGARKFNDDFWEAIGISDPKEFISCAVQTRNYFTHWTTELREQAIPDAELPIVLRRLRLLLAAFILSELGFDEVESVNRLKLVSRDFALLV